jgi:hypothetical protein
MACESPSFSAKILTDDLLEAAAKEKSVSEKLCHSEGNCSSLTL